MISGIFIGLILAIVDIICFAITKYIFLHNDISINWLIIPSILYGCQIWLFYYGLKNTYMSELNITWNILSSVLVTLMGIYIFSEKLSNLKTIAFLLGVVSIILFAVDTV